MVNPEKQNLLKNSAYRLTFFYAIVFFITTLAGMTALYLVASALMKQESNDKLIAEANSLTDFYNQWGPIALSVEITERIQPNRGGDILYLLVNLWKQPLAGNITEWPVEQVEDESWIYFKTDTFDRSAISVRAIKILLLNDLTLLVGLNTEQEEKFQNKFVQAIIIVLILVFVIGGVGGAIVTRKIHRRIDTISKSALKIMIGDIRHRIPLNGSNDEFDRLSQTLNLMLGEIERLMNAIRDVTRNIAHDLRRPLTHLRNYLEKAQTEFLHDTKNYHLIEHAITEADVLLTTFKSILSIAEIDSGASRHAFVQINLAQLLEDGIELYMPLMEEKHLTVTKEIAKPALYHGHPHLLFQTICNLIDNAIKYTPEYGKIAISLEQKSTWLLLTIADNGPGIPEHERERVFEPFVRLEDSRTTSGSGLGLSLVAAVIKLHDAKIILKDNNPGLRVDILLPI